MAPSFGFGDRLGLGTPGHLAALREAGGSIKGIFAQQSVREMARTERTPHMVLQSAAGALESAGFDDVWSADADHLKTPEDVRRLVEAGYVFITLDPSDKVDQQAHLYDRSSLAARYEAVREHATWVDEYRGREMRLGAGRLVFDEATLLRTAVKYGPAIEHAIALAKLVAAEAASRSQPHEIELSVDETAEPTTPVEHFIIAEQLLKSGARLVSLAPRFVGDFEKGVDYKGNLAELEESMRTHAAIAAALGPYKLSLHSGSDKLTAYPVLTRATEGRFHVKTAGTSYLEALRVVARNDNPMFRSIVDFSRSRYDEDRLTYHVSASVAMTPGPESVSDDRRLEAIYLQRWDDVPEGRGFDEPGRQILHCTFGSVMTHPVLGAEVLDLLRANKDAYAEVLREHFVRHLRALS